MSRFLSTLSAVLFYILGGTYFLAIVLNHNGIGSGFPRVWMDIADLPLLLVGLLYGGVSLYRSVRGDTDKSHALMVGIGLPLLILFVLLLVTNFLTPAV